MFNHKHTLTHLTTLVCAATLMLAACTPPPAPPERPPVTPTEPAAETPAVTTTPGVPEAPVEKLSAPAHEASKYCDPLAFDPTKNGVTMLDKTIFIEPDPVQPAFAKGLVIIVGIPDVIEKVVGLVNDRDPNMQLQPLARAAFKASESPADLDAGGTIREAFGGQKNGPSVEISLHRTSKPIAETVQLINTTASTKNLTVFAQPDYMTGRIGGDPWTIGGNPWTIGGNPIGDPAGSGRTFWSQWGLRGVIDKTWIMNNSSGKTSDVNIAIFDTSPFSDTGQYRFKDWFTGLNKIEGAEDAPGDVPLVICVSDPLANHFSQPNSQSITTMESETDTVDYSDHGAFVAGLTHAGAPGAHVELVRSMFKNAEGDAFSLLANLTAYGLTHHNALTQTVINLSLGLRPPVSPTSSSKYDFEVAGFDTKTLDLIYAVMKKVFINEPNWEADFFSSPDVAMRLVMKVLTRPELNNIPYQGATVVAAAGNDAFPYHDIEAQLPARYANVIGVESVAFNGQRSCFSNNTKGKALVNKQAGGDCLGIEITTGKGADKTTWDMVCRPDQDCPYTVTSISVNERQWMRWRGTSFAAAIVSGIEARKLP